MFLNSHKRITFFLDESSAVISSIRQNWIHCPETPRHSIYTEKLVEKNLVTEFAAAFAKFQYLWLINKKRLFFQVRVT